MIISGLLYSNAIAQFGDPYITEYTRAETGGASQNWQMRQHPDGTLFVANNASLRRFDGQNWTGISIRRRALDNLQICDDETIYVIATGEFGHVSSDSLAGLDYHSLSDSLDADLPSLTSLNALSCVDETVYFVGRDGFYEWGSGQLKVTFFDEQLLSVVQSENEIYALDKSGTPLRFSDGEFHPISNHKFHDDFRLRGIVAIDDNSHLILGNRPFVSFLVDDHYREIETGWEHLFEQHSPESVTLLSDGSFAITTRGSGILIIDENGQATVQYNRDSGLATNSVYSVFEDNQSGLWALHDAGLSRIEHFSPFRTWSQESGATMTITDIVRHNNRLIMASPSGTFVLNEETGRIKPFRHTPGWRWTVYLEPNKDELLISGDQGVVVLDEDGEPHQHPYTTSVFRMITSKVDSNLVFISGARVLRAIYRFDDKWKQLDLDLEIPMYIIHAAEANPGELWIAPVNNYLFRLQYDFRDGEVVVHSFEKYDQENGLDDPTFSLFVIDDEVRFAGQNHGMRVFDEEINSFRRETSLHEMINNRQVFRMAQDHEGNIWLRSQHHRTSRVFSTQKKLIPDEENAYKPVTSPFSRMPDVQINAIYPEIGGDVWFGGAQTLVRYQPDKARPTQHNVIANISEVLLRRDSLIYSGYEAPGFQFEAPVFPYGDNEFRFQFGAPYFDNPEETQFQVRLLPVEQEWQAWSYEHLKDYTNLREGHYEFQVRARDVYDNISEAGVFNFRILPPWYRTWWAYTLFGALFFGFIYGLHRYRIIQITKVFETRNRIASDLHDEVSATISSINYFAKALDGAREDDQKYRHLVSMIKEGATDSQDKISDIVWSVSPDKDDWSQLFTHFVRFASDLLESCEMEHQISLPDQIKIGHLDMELRRDLWLILKEIVNNIVKHSQAKHVRIIGLEKNRTLEISIADDGVGFNPDQTQSGFGIRNIKERSKRIGANISIISEPGEGSEFKIVLPL